MLFTGLEGCDVPTVLTLTDTLTGPCTLTYAVVTDSIGFGGPRWSGCRMYSRSASGGSVPCPAMDIPVYWYLFPSVDSTNWEVFCYWFARANANTCPTPGHSCGSPVAYGRAWRQNIVEVKCEGGVFSGRSSIDWGAYNQVGHRGEISFIRISVP